MTRENIVQFMNSTPDPNMMMVVLRSYIQERKEIQWNPTQVNIFELQEAYDYTIMWYSKKFNINILRNADNKVLKIY